MQRVIPLAALGAMLASAAAAETGVVQVTPGVCRALTVHQPAPDVAFQPGVDGRGRPVAPADLPDGRRLIDAPIMVEIDVDLLRRLGIPIAGGRRLDGRVSLGQVEIAPEGGVSLNRRPLPDAVERRLASACAREFSKTIK